MLSAQHKITQTYGVMGLLILGWWLDKERMPWTALRTKKDWITSDQFLNLHQQLTADKCDIIDKCNKLLKYTKDP